MNAALLKVPGVLSLGFDLLNSTMTVEYVPSEINPDRLIALISSRCLMAVSLIETRSASTKDRTETSWKQSYTTVLSGLAIFAAIGASKLEAPGWLISNLYFCSILLGGIELFPKALRSLRQFHFDIHVLMGLAVVGASLLGQWDEAATIAFLFGLSELLERLSLSRARDAVRALLEVAPNVPKL